MSDISSSDPLLLPVLPLRDLVLFPGVSMPIAAGRPATLRAIEAAHAQKEPLILAVTQRNNVPEVNADGLYSLGTIARIEQVQRTLAGVQVLLHGHRRGNAMRYETTKNGYLQAVVREVGQTLPLNANDPAFLALYREARIRAAELGQKSGLAEETVRQVLAGIENPARFADLVAGYIDVPQDERQNLLETLSVEERMRRVLIHVQRQIDVLNAQEDLKSKVQEELGDRQREIYLREQLKAIQRELGDEGEEDDLEELSDKLSALELPPEGRKEVDRELKRLRRFGREAMEAQVIRTFLETVAELPWSERSDERLQLEPAAEILDEDHYGLEDVKDRILEFLAVRQLQTQAESARQAAAETEAEAAAAAAELEPEVVAAVTGGEAAAPAPAAATADLDETSKGPILLFVGPPGVGKTSLAKSIARAMGREYVRISLGGARDEADIRGHRRTYVGAMPGRIIKGMKQAGTKNPVFLLDEIDKLGVSFQGDPASALLEVLDPAQNDSFTDHYLGIPFDLSEVLFICTANFLQHIPAPLLDRMEMVEFDGYTEGEKLAIARRYLIPRQVRRNGLSEDQIRIPDPAVSQIISEYTREAGVRQLEREVGRVARKVARKIATGEHQTVEVQGSEIKKLLGRPKVHPEKMADYDQVGVATGMYYTPTGGDIMFVEASTMPGKGKLTLTGQLGDVMKESAQAAWSYARSHSEGLHIKAEEFDRDVHIHCPAGAIPKDGPSAGVTMATALVSSLSGRPARHDIAMTGEITLNGRVLPIGGVKEKILGGVRAGIRTFLLPKANEADLEDLPREVRETIRAIPVEELGEVFAVALRDATYHKGRLLFGDQKPDDVVPLSAHFAH
jgi:ATP-dependent Lon protease